MTRRLLVASALLACLSPACATAPPAGSPETGYAVFGFVGHTPQQAAPNETVLVVDAGTGETVMFTATNFMGKYTVAGLPPGRYFIRAGERELEVLLEDENRRLDIDLSSETGVMDYGRAAVTEAVEAGRPGGGVPGPAGPHDADLARQIAGTWWGYSGSTETKLALCPDGSFRDDSESGYSGKFDHDAGAWGTAAQQGGSGSWTIQGDTQTGTITLQYSGGGTQAVTYRQTGESGCLTFNRTKLCRTSASCD